VEPAVWRLHEGHGPVVAVALHHGHDLRPEVAKLIALDEAERLREEDPYTGGWTDIADTGVVVERSRFEVDMNRPRDLAVYLEPERAWGLRVWR
jgi:N-formylglutamate deformylase